MDNSNPFSLSSNPPYSSTYINNNDSNISSSSSSTSNPFSSSSSGQEEQQSITRSTPSSNAFVDPFQIDPSVAVAPQQHLPSQIIPQKEQWTTFNAEKEGSYQTNTLSFPIFPVGLDDV